MVKKVAKKAAKKAVKKLVKKEKIEVKETPRKEVPKKEIPEEPAKEPAAETQEKIQKEVKLRTDIAKNLQLREITTEMEESYLDYAMSVIVARALPDVRDGLKPVHRRILYAMSKLGLTHGAKFVKSARIVGDCLGRYHPHGDAAVYETLVRLAQPFSLRYPLVHGQGNFGSIDGDAAAAMRYTEAKMEKITEEMLADIERETVKFQPNYDGTNEEPSVLPAKLPQLLLNGTMGIAVGMATNIPPHNLSETIDALIYLADNPKATVEDLMEYVKGPDFPTGGTIYDWKAIQEMYINGRGGITIRAKAAIEEGKGNRFHIIISEVPYQVNKASLIEKMASLVQDKRIQGISDIRDESSRNEIRVVIDLKKDAYPKKILNALYKYTDLQTNFNMNMIALVDGIQPRLLNLKLVLEYFIKHRIEVITNRCTYDLKVAKDREHILEGLTKALKNIDAIIKTIKQSADREDAHKALMKQFKLTDRQSNAILDMRLQTLAGLERKKIEDELKEKQKLISYLEDVLKSPKKIIGIMKDELADLKKTYGDERRTRIVKGKIGEFSDKDTIPNEPMVLTLSRENYIKRITPNSFRAQHRGGKGIIGTTTKDEDEVRLILHANNHDEVLFFTNKGRIFQLPVYEVPMGSRISKGQSIVNLLHTQEGETITAMLNMEGGKLSKKFLFMATKNGTVKKTETTEFEKIRRSGLIAIKLRESDSLEWVRETSGEDQVVIVTENGKCIRFNEKDVRPLGRASTGVRGIMLQKNDCVVEMDIVSKGARANLLVVTENGIGKYTSLAEYRQQHRGGTGVKTASITAKTGKIIGARVLEEGDEGDLLLISKKGQTIRLHVKDIPGRGRATQGVYLMRLKPGDHIASISVFKKEEIEKGTEDKKPVAEKEEKRQAAVIK